MKKNILLAFCCCSLLAFTACSDDYNDATSKHVYGENENPYLKIDTEAQISATGALEVNGEHSYTVKLSDYAAKFEEKMGMSVDAVIDGLSTGETVFYPINTTRNQWLKTPYNKDDAGWYFNSANQPCAQDDEACKASVVLDKTNKELVFELTEGGITAGTVLALEVGFAKNGPDYDNYVRFTLNASVTDPTVAVATVELPNTDYTADDILLTSIEENIAAVFEMTLEEFITAFDEGTVKFYGILVVSNASSTLSGGRIVGMRRASIVLPEPGAPIINTLCPPAAAISSARFTAVCPFTSAKSSA